jgi:hypothetical protein
LNPKPLENWRVQIIFEDGTSRDMKIIARGWHSALNKAKKNCKKDKTIVDWQVRSVRVRVLS